MEQIGSSYVESFNKQGATGLAALYASGGVFVNPTGAHTDFVKLYEGMFKAGISTAETKVDQVWPLGADTALGMGRYRVTGKDQSGAQVELAGLWTATHFQEGGKLKIRMLTSIPEPRAAR